MARPSQERLWAREYNDGLRLLERGADAEAEAHLRRALTRAETAGMGGERRACTLYQLATLYEGEGRHPEAESFYRRALEAEERALGADHPYVAMILRAYARLLRKLDRHQEAAAAEERVEAIWSGAEHSHLDEWGEAIRDGARRSHLDEWSAAS